MRFDDLARRPRTSAGSLPFGAWVACARVATAPKRGQIGRLAIDELEVGRRRVGEVIVDRQRET